MSKPTKELFFLMQRVYQKIVFTGMVLFSQEVGVDEIDDMLRQGIPLIEEGEKLIENFKNAINMFKKVCEFCDE